ncbi:hypothetical protein GCM10023185_23510 [Hymenobacter saemangeumensis]|uniref:Uncharacterized protein n=1 Tax=Hymenobacter saemangeumensis TaxID=1084522 RepID=A0ABP8IG69_9BACT
MVLLAGLLGLLYAGYWQKNRSDSPELQPATATITCYALGQAFAQDSAAADRQFRGKTLALEGLLAGLTDDDAERDRRGEFVWIWQRSYDYVALIGATRQGDQLLVQGPAHWRELSPAARQQSRLDSLLWVRGKALNTTSTRPYVLVQVQLLHTGLDANFPANELPGARMMQRWTTTFNAYEASRPLGRGLRSQLLTHRLLLNARYRRYSHRADSTLMLHFDQGDSVRAAPL